EQFALAVQGPDVFFLKIDLHAFFLELAHRGQAVYRISGKAADRFGNDKVYLASQCIRHHAFESLAVLGIRTRYALVRIHGNKLPIVPAFDIVGVIVHLGAVAGELLLAVRGNTGVGGGAALFLFIDRRCRESAYRRRYCRYFRHVFPSISVSLLLAYAVFVPLYAGASSACFPMPSRRYARQRSGWKADMEP